MGGLTSPSGRTGKRNLSRPTRRECARDFGNYCWGRVAQFQKTLEFADSAKIEKSLHRHVILPSPAALRDRPGPRSEACSTAPPPTTPQRSGGDRAAP